MKKAVVTIGAITAVCACSLVIDPDKLVEGNTAGGAPATPDGGDANDAGRADGANDGGSASDVPECVPPRPSRATEGPYAVVEGPIGSTLKCPPGYLPTPVATAKDDVTAATPAVCGDTTGCTCGAPMGTPTCALRVRYFDDSNCTEEVDTPTSVTTTCRDLESRNHVRVEYAVTGLTCAPSGTAMPTAKPTATFKNDVIVCAPDPNAKTAACKDGLVALPPASNAAACVIVPIGEECSSSDYRNGFPMSKSGELVDTRACTCACDGAQASCQGGSATTFANAACSGTSRHFDAMTCFPRLDDDSVEQLAGPSASSSPGCTARATATGEIVAKNDLKLCCL